MSDNFHQDFIDSIARCIKSIIEEEEKPEEAHEGLKNHFEALIDLKKYVEFQRQNVEDIAITYVMYDIWQRLDKIIKIKGGK